MTSSFSINYPETEIDSLVIVNDNFIIIFFQQSAINYQHNTETEINSLVNDNVI